MSSPHEVTRLLKQWADGEDSALEALTPLVYGELRRLAAGYMRKEAPGNTLQPTALVHEAFLRLVGHHAPECENRSQFYGVAAHLMREILVDHARSRQAAKRGGGFAHVTLEEEAMVLTPDHDAGLMALDEALERLAALDARKGRVVELRFFGGLSVEESAEVLGVSDVTIRRDWQFAKTWLLRELSGEKRHGTGAPPSN
ncbi:MAG: RNA polymerase subunit sigma-70 [Terriglobia bacterium]|nr:MAG: RNA polymerase subunit sigma-70 [Terriglobia bacterium]